MTRMLPALVVAGTVAMTTAIVHSLYGLFWLTRYAVTGTASAFDELGALCASGLAAAMVLLASFIAQRLLSGWPEDLLGPRAVRIPVRVRRVRSRR